MGEKRATCSKQHFFLNKTLLSEEGRQDRAGTGPTQQNWRLAGPWGFWMRFSPQMFVTNSLSTRAVLSKCWHKTGKRATASTPVLTGNFPATLLLMEEPLQVTQHPEMCQAEGEKWGSVSQRAAQGWKESQPCPPGSSQERAARWSLAEPSWLSKQHILPFTLQAMNGNPSPQITLLISTERDQECTWLSVLPVQI